MRFIVGFKVRGRTEQRMSTVLGMNRLAFDCDIQPCPLEERSSLSDE